MNWFNKPKITHKPLLETNSILYDESTFYNRFKQDLLEAKQEVIIESPFITTRRLEIIKPIIERLVARGVQVFVMPRLPHEHDEFMSEQAEDGIRYFEELGVQVLLCTGGHHRKLAMIDRKVLWEGSLNILCHGSSEDTMRKMVGKKYADGYRKLLNLRGI